eukprot:Gregarina_sp_Poly_1__1233@NODE_12_length_23383_cov_104_521445_g10_i0_p3_GENE_NODE_12_length_23383_cov_104_521445_g10_i0NODE_12_length_23383_cov_104_521445_g10_i0_p3_ORF_typecomplete_len1084_score177_26PARP/PF00644_20/3_3e36PARP_reg/PF02877_14/1_9e03PARP_reg/PF02877_14/2_2e22WGR/PF05406_15/3_5WGR/PF05406_15/4e06PADR1/PF08063_12/6_8e03PADR1/PF08063_12/1_3e08zfPARP/PF00645_18/2_9e06G7MTase/PF12803_7/1_6e03G7MTase/PF12803_7/0_043DZR/PF12773_7/9_4DZR/PF12773_7/71DZR/PF12773_7/3_4e03DZR/PF12773_7/1_8e
MGPRVPAGPSPEIPRQFSVDYAPSGRATCKKCGSLIDINTPRFCRKVRSPWHDGFDIQTSHLCCGTKWATALDQIHYLGLLAWEDFLQAADEWDCDINLGDKEIKGYKQVLDTVNELRTFWMSKKIPTNLMLEIIKSNNYEEQTLHKMKGFMLAHIITDGLLRGLPPVCPICQNQSLISAGFSLYCHGYVDTTTKCDFHYDWAPVANTRPAYNDKLPEKVKLELQERKHFIIPERSSSLPALKEFKKKLAVLSKLSSSFKSSILSEKTAKAEPVSQTSATLLHKISSKQLCSGLCVSPLGQLTLSRAALQQHVFDAGGVWLDDPLKFKDVPSGFVQACIAKRALWATTKTQVKCQNILAGGLAVLDESWLMDLLNLDVENRDPSMQTGASLRLAKNSQPYKLFGSIKDIPLIERDPQISSRSVPKRPRVKKNSPLMKVDEWFPSPQSSGWIEQIYVDKHNHAFSAMTSYCELETGRNSFYLIQLVERFQIIQSLTGQKKRKLKSDPSTKRKNRSSKVVDNEDTSDKLEYEEVFNNTVFSGPYVDHVSLSDEDYEHLQSCKTSLFYVFRKWGRLGSDHKTTNDSLCEEFGQNLAAAQGAFCSKFLELTGVDFFYRFEDPGKTGRYQFVDLEGYDYGNGIGKSPDVKKEVSLPKPMPSKPVSQLPVSIQDLITFIFNTEILRSSLESMRLDTSNLDLKSLSIPQLEQGFRVLTEIEELLKNRPRFRGDTIEESRFELKIRGLSSKYYAIVPHAFDIKDKPPPINTLRSVRQKCAILDDFIEAVRSAKALDIDEVAEIELPSVDVYYNKLLFDLTSLGAGTEIYGVIEQMIEQGHAPTHNSFALKLQNVYAIIYRDSAPQTDISNKKLLWHGSRLSNWAGILTSGLRIAPPEAPVSGYMFDKGVYFADLISKSAQYCHASTDQSRAFLLLCEVSLGTQYLRVSADERARKTVTAKGCNSTWGIGETGPNPRTSKITESIHGDESKLHKVQSKTRRALQLNQVEIPVGQQVSNKLQIEQVIKQSEHPVSPHLLYNEFVVYDTVQIAARYLVEVSFEFKSFLDAAPSASSSMADSEDSSAENISDSDE